MRNRRAGRSHRGEAWRWTQTGKRRRLAGKKWSGIVRNKVGGGAAEPEVKPSGKVKIAVANREHSGGAGKGDGTGPLHKGSTLKLGVKGKQTASRA